MTTRCWNKSARKRSIARKISIMCNQRCFEKEYSHTYTRTYWTIELIFIILIYISTVCKTVLRTVLQREELIDVDSNIAYSFVALREGILRDSTNFRSHETDPSAWFTISGVTSRTCSWRASLFLWRLAKLRDNVVVAVAIAVRRLSRP